ncbi:hypothetical protein Enr13x_59960 [Stieleria neptunia]|uniref:S1 motif domain-containing protein n=1 Tax=Stieleria neptunia TaxID=2527979 RepID=A0A518HZ18_9BACT|nr:hypothetical protein [Stieleria neptunia]QDV46092.1 hypothetical protein Enr13x_59960 [Stieleria neptunia]
MPGNPLNRFDSDWEEKIRVHFADHIPKPIPDRNTIVTGYVVANAPFGIFVDIGYGVPAVLGDVYIGHDQQQKMDPHWTKPLGTKICAKIGDDTGQYPKLHQWDYEEWGPQHLAAEV